MAGHLPDPYTVWDLERHDPHWDPEREGESTVSDRDALRAQQELDTAMRALSARRAAEHAKRKNAGRGEAA
jgi:hypothetical protein